MERYLEKAAVDILAIGQTLEEHTKKVVQMHYLARNFAAKLKEELLASDNEILFGETMSYKKIYMGMNACFLGWFIYVTRKWRQNFTKNKIH